MNKRVWQIYMTPYKVEVNRVQNGERSYKTYKRPRLMSPSYVRLARLVRKAHIGTDGLSYSMPFVIHGKPFGEIISRVRILYDDNR